MSERKLKVLMFGWEFPPHNSGGLGTACFGLSKALVEENVEVTFVLPKHLDVDNSATHIKFADSYLPKNITFKTVRSLLKPYVTSEEYLKIKGRGDPINYYGDSLLEEVKLYALRARQIVETTEFDVIHAHDWLAYGAGVEAKHVSHKPLVVHVHATEFDRTGGTGVNQDVYDIEKRGMEEADAVITVSNFTKNIVIDRYGIMPNKVRVVHNGIEEFSTGHLSESKEYARLKLLKKSGKKVVLFVGRITVQKGPDYFLKAARKVVDYYPNVYFVIAGSGDMQNQIVRDAAYLGLADKIIFAGFLRGLELDAMYRIADLFVMPSVSEPFGLTALEAVQHGTPVLLSKQSGVSEVLTHAMKVDFWDVDEMANQIVVTLFHESLQKTIRENASKELPSVSWHKAAERCVEIYRNLVSA